MDQSNTDRAAKAQPATLNSTIGYGSRRRPAESASGIVELAVHMPQKLTLNQRLGVLRVQDPGRDRAQTAAATQIGPASVVSRYA
jgi:hypothetical protein